MSKITILPHQRKEQGEDWRLVIINLSHTHAGHSCPGPDTCGELRLVKRLHSKVVTEYVLLE